MRPLHLSDLHHAACALRGRPLQVQASQMAAAVAAADTADRYRKALHRSHPSMGHGTLSSTFGPVAEPQSCDLAYLHALQIVVAALIARGEP